MSTNNKYIETFTKLNVSRSNGVAPHKPILLLSVIQSIEQGEIKDNRIYITAELVARFRENWHLLVQTDKYTSNFSLPFYHLKTDKFWHLQTYPGATILLTSSASIRSFSALKNAVEYAFLDVELFDLLQNAADRNLLKDVLVTLYFNGIKKEATPYRLFETIEKQILNESPAEYKNEINPADEEANFIRCSVFKKVVPGIYNYTCCISGMRIVSNRDIQMVDACHVVPFSFSHDDTIKNGISLSPNFHRAFDRFLITVALDYKVLVAENFTESDVYSIRMLHGRTILLPNEEKYYPSRENLKWHNDKFHEQNR